MMKMLQVTLLLVVTTATFAQVRLPPQITVQPKSEIYRNDKTIIMDCEAKGVPDVTFTWEKNGVDFDLNKANVKRLSPTKGSFEFGPLTTLDEGYYQCFASNLYGKALSQMALLQRAVLNPFDDLITQEYPVNQGDKLKVECEKTKVFPPPVYSWKVAQTEQDKNPVPVELSSRIQMDTEGNLYFANVESTDYPNLIYKCNLYNPITEITVTGSYSKLLIKEGSPASTRPLKEFSSENVVGLKGEEIQLKCLFSGYPTPKVKWTRVGGSSLPIGRHDKIDYDTTLKIWELKESDEGTYRCTGENQQDKSEEEISLKVDIRPVYENKNQRPHNMNKTVGEAVSFICDAVGKPEPNTQWYINGEALDPNTPGPRRTITNNGRNLTITDLCKDCGNDQTDLMVVQCNASNVHGYAYAEGYLNVVLKTILTVEPSDITMADWDNDVFFPCEAKSDDSTEITMTWLFNGIQIDTNKPLYEVTGSGLYVHHKKVDSKEEKEAIEGEYTCQANNGMSTASKVAQLVIPEAPAPVTASAGFPLWLLILLIVLCVLILLIICCCCCCLWRQRNKGDEYPVDEKERRAGRDPLKEIDDNKFKDYQRPEDKPLQGSGPSLSSIAKLNESDDDDDLDQYGEPDTSKFNEEGSFIGQYQEKQRGRGNYGYNNDSIV